MLTRQSALGACAAAVLGLVVTSSGYAASVITRLNHLTFRGAVGLPGVTRNAGTYMFDVVPDNPTVVRVLSRNGSAVHFTGFTRRVARPASLRAHGSVTFAETSRGVAPRISAWYPGVESSGYQFIYSR